MSGSAPAIPLSHALARFGPSRLAGVEQGTPGLSRSRLAVLRLLEAAAEPLNVSDIGEATELHANTVRGHLDALMAAGRVARVPGPRGDRGRPLWLYSSATGDTLSELSSILTTALKSATAPELASMAARSWAEALPELPASSGIDEAVDSATATLTELGFDAVRNAVGDEVSLRACPYASLVRDHPVICDVHAALLVEVLKRTEQPVALAGLDVFPRPTICVAHLSRPDTAPAWVVTMEESS